MIENVWIDGNNAGNGRGISDGGGELYVNNVTISNQSGTGISITPATTATSIHLLLNNVRIYNCNFGVAAGNGTRLVANNVVVSGCTLAGFLSEGISGASEMFIRNSVSSNNGTGVQNGGGGAGTTIRLSTM